jgi:predicted S18 family serine protease
MATALMSSITGRKVRKEVGMTGEITLRGKVLPIGGLKEKVLAAHRAGVKKVIIPEENRKYLEEMPAFIHKDLKFIPVTHIEEVFKIALHPQEKAPRAGAAKTPAAVARKRAAVKPAAPAAKKASRTAAKPAVKPALKRTARPAAKKAGKAAARTAVKPAAKRASRPAAKKPAARKTPAKKGGGKTTGRS